MDFELNSLVELYAYKVNDLLAGNEPRGGKASLLQLRKFLLEANLPGAVAKQFREIDRLYKERSETAPQQPQEEPPPEEAPDVEIDLGILDIPLDDEQPPEPAPSQTAQQIFAEQVYWTRLKRELGRIARGFLSGKRYELRLAYAFLQNFEAYSQTPSFASDFNLSRFELSEPIPRLSDPLVSLDTEEVAVALLMEIFRIAIDLGNLKKYPLSLPPEGIVPYLRRFLRHIVESPEALLVKPPGGGPTTDELRAALDEARRSALTAHEREALVRDLEEKLRKAAADERRMRLVADEDRGHFLTAAARLTSLLQRYLPAPRGEAELPNVPPPWEDDDQKQKMEEIPKDATMVTIKRVPARLRLGGIPITVSVAGEDTQLTVAGNEYWLKEQEPLIIPLENWEVWVFRYEDYLHLRLEVREGAQLSQLLTEGAVLAHLVHPYKNYAYLRLLRAFSARLKGPVNYQDFSAQSASRFAEAPAETLELFSRKGLEVVKNRLQRTPGGLKLLQEVANNMGLEVEGQKLLRVLSDWLNYRPPTRETLGGELGVATISSDPISIQAGSLVLSIRRSEGVVYVGSAGSVPRKLEDLIIWPIESEAVVIAREGNRVAHSKVKIS